MANFDLDENLRASVISALKEVVLYHPERAGRLEPLILRLQATEPTKAPTTSLRDQFAMATLNALHSNPAKDYDFDGAARDAYRQADAMLAAREAGNE